MLAAAERNSTPLEVLESGPLRKPQRKRSEGAAGHRPNTELFALAAAPGIDTTKLEVLVAAEERRAAREEQLAYAAAFADMAAELPIVDENGVIRHGEKMVGTYALWEDINEAIRPILHRFGFSLSFRIEQDDSSITVTAVLAHKRGHSSTTSIRLPPDLSAEKNSVQAVGSTVSYGKRYAASALLNLVSRGCDDDAKSASDRLSQHQLDELEQRLVEVGADRERLLRYLRAETLAALPSSRFEEAMAALACKAVFSEGRC